jgi:hypothetical protein
MYAPPQQSTPRKVRYPYQVRAQRIGKHPLKTTLIERNNFLHGTIEGIFGGLGSPHYLADWKEEFSNAPNAGICDESCGEKSRGSAESLMLSHTLVSESILWMGSCMPITDGDFSAEDVAVLLGCPSAASRL